MKYKPPLLSIQNLSLVIPTPNYRTLLSDISFDIEAGETVGLIGGSGSGKSLIVRSILDLLPFGTIRHGTIRFEGDLLQKDQVIGKKIGTVFQDPMTALNPLFRISTQLMESIYIHRKLRYREARKVAVNLLEAVEMADPEQCLNAFPYELSGGMRQRVCLAIALAADPQLLIADEPTTALDVTVQKEIVHLMIRLQKERNLAILWISHDLPLVAQLCERLLVLHEGSFIETGITDKIFTTPEHPYTQSLLSAIPNYPRICYE